MKLTYVIHIYKSMFPVKKAIESTNIFCIVSQKSFPIHCVLRGNFLKPILTYLCCTLHNEIKICHLDVQIRVSYKK